VRVTGAPAGLGFDGPGQGTRTGKDSSECYSRDAQGEGRFANQGKTSRQMPRQRRSWSGGSGPVGCPSSVCRVTHAEEVRRGDGVENRSRASED
jgi:hypothetical protein